MDEGRSTIRTVSVALGLALVGFGVWRSFAEFRLERREALASRRRVIAETAGLRFSDAVDSLCHRRGGDSLAHRNAIAWESSRSGLSVRVRGRDGGWDWGCLQTPDSGIVVYLAVDTGCATGHPDGLWSHACRTVVQPWDLRFAAGPSARVGTSVRSLWSYPGSSRVCPAGDRSDPPVDSLVQERCARPPAM